MKSFAVLALIALVASCRLDTFFGGSGGGAPPVAGPPADLRFTIKDPTNPAAYPITSQTFALVYQDPCKAGLSSGKAKALKTFLDYGLGAGQSVLKQLSYAPLPAAIDSKAKALVGTMTCNGSPIA